MLNFTFTRSSCQTAARISGAANEFLQLSAQELTKIIETDQLNVKERTVFEAVLHWIAHAPEERREYTALLLSNVRLALLSPEYIMETMQNNKLVKANEDCRSLLLEASKIILDTTTREFSDFIHHHPLSCPRLPPALLLAIGGWSGGSPTSGIEAEHWINVSHNEMIPSAYIGTAFLKGSVYCVGGFDSIEQFSTMYKLDLSTHTWQEMAPMHSRRCYVSVTTMDGYIYAMGGYDGQVRLNTAERYQPTTNQWTLIASMQEQRSDANCTSLYGKIYICGGFNGNECLSTAECYNPKTDQWTLIAHMINRRSGVGVIAYARHIFAVGGFNGISRLRTVEAYNPDSHSWHDEPSMLSPRSNFGIAVIDNRLFVVRGFNGFTTTCDVECYDTEARDWFGVSDMDISRSAPSCCVAYGLTTVADYTFPHYSYNFSSEEEDGVMV